MTQFHDRFHYEVLDALWEWWEDVVANDCGSQCVVLPVPRGWGRTTALEQFKTGIEASESSALVAMFAGGSAPEGVGVQARWIEEQRLSDEFAARLAKTFGFDTNVGAIARAVDFASLLATAAGVVLNLSATIGVLLGRLGLDYRHYKAAGTEAHAISSVRRLGASLAEISLAKAPLAVLIDDAEGIDPRLVEGFAEALVERRDGRVLVVVVAGRGTAIYRRLIRNDRLGGNRNRFNVVDGQFVLNADHRRALAAECLPGWSREALDRIVQRTESFSDVYRIAGLEGAANAVDATDPVALVDQLVTAALGEMRVDRWEIVTAWAGGVLHRTQLEAALAQIGSTEQLPAGKVISVNDPVQAKRAAAFADVQFSTQRRHQIAETIVATGVDVTSDATSTAIDVIVASRPIQNLHERGEVGLNQDEERSLDTRLAEALEAVGDLAEACSIARQVLARHRTETQTGELGRLFSLLVRCGDADDVGAELPQGAVTSIETRVWHTVALLRNPTTAQAGVTAAIDLDSRLRRETYGDLASEWRLLLARDLIRSRHPAIAAQILRPILVGPSEQPHAQIARQLLSFGPVGERHLQRACWIPQYKNRQHIEPYLNHVASAESAVTGQPVTVADQDRRIRAVEHMLAEISEWGWDDAPTRRLIFRSDHPRLPRPLPRYIPVDADRRLTSELEQSAYRISADALLLARAVGLRIGELLDLELDCVHQISGHGAWLKVPLGKLDTERMVPLDDETVALIDRIAITRSTGRPIRHPRTRRPTQFLFTHHGRRLSQTAVRKELARSATIAGIGHVTPHQLRHTYATALVNAGVSLQALMALLGHVSAEMSLRYAHLFDATVRAEYERALDLAKTRIGPIATPTGRTRIPVTANGSCDHDNWRDAPAIKARLAGGHCLRAPAQGSCPYANICEHCPNFRTDTASLGILAAQRVDTEALAADAQRRGWIDEAERHHRLLDRLDHLIAQTG